MGFVKRIVPAALGVAASLGVGASAWAQQTPTTATAPAGRVTTVDLIADLIYNSNVAYSDAQLAAARGLTLADEIINPDASFVLARRVGGQTVFVQGDAGYVYHRVNSQLDREKVDVTAGVNARYLRCQEVVSGEYAARQSDLAETQLGVVSNFQQVGTVAGMVTCGRSIGLAPSVSVSQSWRDNSNVLMRQVNSNSFTVSPSLAYQQPALGALSLFATYAKTDYPNQTYPGPLGLLTGGYNLYAGGVRYDRRLGGRIEGTVTVSYTSLDQNGPGSQGFSGLTYAADLTYHVSSRLHAHANATRATTPSDRLGANYSVDETYEGDLTYALGPRLTISGTYSHRIRDYPGGSPLIVNDLTHEVSDQFTADATYELNRRVRLSLIAGDTERTANFPGLSFSSTTVELETRASF
jgi:hypothetical protein